MKNLWNINYVFRPLWGKAKMLISITLLISLLTVWPDFMQCVLPESFVFPWSLVISIIVYKSFNSNNLRHFLMDV